MSNENDVLSASCEHPICGCAVVQRGSSTPAHTSCRMSAACPRADQHAGADHVVGLTVDGVGMSAAKGLT